MNGNDLTVKTLQAAVDWIVNESSDDICQICAYYNAAAQAAELDKDENIEPCFYCRTNGKTACRNGIIEHFQKQVKYKLRKSPNNEEGRGIIPVLYFCNFPHNLLYLYKS